MILKFLAICCLIMACGITGCTTINLSPEVGLLQPDQKKIPIKIGYHYVANKPFPQVINGFGNITSVKISDESMKQGVKAVAQSAFEDAVELSLLDVDALPNDVPLILISETVSFMAYIKGIGEDRAGFKMKWTIIDTQNKVVWMDTVLSEAVDHCSFRPCMIRMMERSTSAQFQNACNSILKYEWWK